MTVEVAGAVVGLLVGMVSLIGLVWRLASLMAKTESALGQLMTKVERLERLEEKLAAMAALDFRVALLERENSVQAVRLRDLELKVGST